MTDSLLETIPEVTVDALLARYEVLLFDAYGVLVRSDGAVAGAPALIRRLEDQGIEYFVLTNDASRLISTSAQRYRDAGLPIPTERVITSGSLLTRYFDEHDLAGAPTLVLGEGDAVEYARQAGAQLLALEPDADPAVVVLAELSSASLLADMEAILTATLRRCDRGEPPRLVLPNPDLIYPRSVDTYGLTAGAAAATFEAILADRYPGDTPRFDRLGKPYPFIYEEGAVRAGVDLDQMVMIGDQLGTDVRGALEFGVDAALVATGLTALHNLPARDWPCTPTWMLTPFDA